MPSKPDSPSSTRNREPILGVLRRYFADTRSVLEIGSGTGQHAVHFAAALPHLTWQCSDRVHYLHGITQWLEEAGLPNTPPAFELDVAGKWPVKRYDAVFSANTLHIMAWEDVEAMFASLPGILKTQGKLVIYGPFNYAGNFTSESNAAFDAGLKRDAPHRGIRDFEAVDALARQAGLKLLDDVAMPANNRCLVWQHGD